MNRYYYDFHVHSCLSPCGDDDMTPNNIAGMASLAGLNIVALTDHNSARNCPAFFAVAKRYGIIPVAGMELTTAEEIHVVCLFEWLDDALRFNDMVDGHVIDIKNRPDIFGNQYVMDENDQVVSVVDRLLITATDISIDCVPQLVKEYNGICFPAHIDRETNGIISILGTFPEELEFIWAEFHDADKKDEYIDKYAALKNKRFVVGSDAHYLEQIQDKQFSFELDDEPYSSAAVRKELFLYLRGDKV